MNAFYTVFGKIRDFIFGSEDNKPLLYGYKETSLFQYDSDSETNEKEYLFPRLTKEELRMWSNPRVDKVKSD